MNKTEIIQWLTTSDAEALDTLWTRADRVRQAHVGDEVHLRGLIELSNYCVRACAYCGINAANTRLARYRMTAREITDCARQAADLGYGTVVLQAGEDYGVTAEMLADTIRHIKSETPLAVTLSMGERPLADLHGWRVAGADRYLLRFETSDRALYRRIHPARAGAEGDRFDILAALKTLEYQVGSGVMIGLPGQTYETLTDDILMFQSLDLDMIGVGPYIPHPDTPLGALAAAETTGRDSSAVPRTELMAYKVIALARILCPDAHIPSTTAIATLNAATGRELGLQRGANVVMPNITPPAYRALYEIYPDKACAHETADACAGCVKNRIAAIGRRVGTGPGHARQRPPASPASDGLNSKIGST